MYLAGFPGTGWSFAPWLDRAPEPLLLHLAVVQFLRHLPPVAGRPVLPPPLPAAVSLVIRQVVVLVLVVVRFLEGLQALAGHVPGGGSGRGPNWSWVKRGRAWAGITQSVRPHSFTVMSGRGFRHRSCSDGQMYYVVRETVC